MKNALRLALTLIAIAAAPVSRIAASPNNGIAPKQVMPESISLPGNAASQKAPLSFIENKGQVTDQDHKARTDIQFRLGAANGLSIFVGDGAIHYQFSKADDPDAVEAQVAAMQHPDPNSKIQIPNSASYTMYRMDVELIGADKHAKVVTEQEQDYCENYFTPGTGDNGATAHAYNRITYKNVYPHIDWVLYTSNGQLKHEFVVRQGGKVSDIKLKYGGATDLKLNNEGGLVANTPQGSITENTPYTYQQDGKKITSNFKLNGDVLSYEAGNYSGELVIDPTLLWATFYGGPSYQIGMYVAVDASGNVFMGGTTASTSSIATSGAYQTTLSGGTNDCFLVKFDASGNRQWATYYGGSGWDQGGYIAVDGSGNVYISGLTASPSGIATSGAYQTFNAGGSWDAFLVKFNGSGVRQWATFYGGTGDDYGYTVATDPAGNVYLGGATNTTSGMASSGAYQTTCGAGNDGFIVKFNSSGTRQWATYYGGNGYDWGYRLATDGAGNVFLAGWTSSTTGIATSGAYQTSNAGNGDGFLVKFDGSGNLQWGTFYGGAGYDNGYGVAADVSGNVYLSGSTQSTSGIASSGAYQTTYGGGSPYGDAFLVKFDGTGARQWGTYYGGSADDYGFYLAADGNGNVYMTGNTVSTSGIATAGAYQATFGGGAYDAFLATFSSSGSLQYATYYGGSGDENGYGIAADGSGNVYISGNSTSLLGMGTSGGYQPSNTGTDAFLAKFSCGPVIPSITGNTTVCAGSTTALSDTASGGTWSSSNTAIAKVGSTGIVTGVANGTATITYKASNTCGIGAATTTVFVGISAITTVAGNGTGGYIGDNGQATASELNGPWSVTKDGAGNMYIADQNNHAVRKVTPSGVITTIAGTGTYAYSGDNGPASSASLRFAWGIASDPTGNIYVGSQWAVRKINTSGIITTIVGNGVSAGSGGDGGPSTAAGVSNVTALAIDASGNLYLADYVNNRVRKISTSGIITTVAGNGTAAHTGDGLNATSASINGPESIAIDNAGNLYIGESGVFAPYTGVYIRKVSPSGIISTIAGTGTTGFSGDNGPSTAAALNEARGMTTDASGNLYFADYNNLRVREITTAGIITTVAGGGATLGDGGPATAALISGAVGVYIDATGALYITTGDSRIRKVNMIQPYPGVITGNTNVCVGNTTTLTDITSTGTLGTWSSGNTSIATVNSSGIVTGVSNGITTITYTVSNGCGSAIATTSVNVGVPLISTIAGNGIPGFSGDGSAAIAAEVFNVWGVCADAAKNVYIADNVNHRVRKINASGIISTIAGNGTSSNTGDGFAATASTLYYPYCVTLDAAGNLYVGDAGAVRKINTAGIISTVAGTGFSGFSGDNGSATIAQVGNVTGVRLDAAGNIYIVDQTANRVRKISTTGIITTVAGSGTPSHSGDGFAATTATLNNPTGITVDASGNLYITEAGADNYIRKVNTSGVISTIAGTGAGSFGGDGGAATAAQLYSPYDLCTDATGNLYISDASNYRVRMINTSGIISTVAGNGTSTYSGDGGAATAAGIYPIGVFVDNTGALYIGDYTNRRVRKVNTIAPSAGAITGNTNVCPGNTTTLTDITATGITSAWSSSNTGVATVGSTGVVTGVSIGTATITFTSGNGCGSNYTTANVYVGISTITTIAGNGIQGSSGDGAAATAAQLNHPWGVVTDPSGNVYFSDLANNRVRKISTSGVITTIAGTGTAGYSGDGFAATNAKMNTPRGIAMDAAGNIYVAEDNNYIIRKINTSGIISTVAGTGSLGTSPDGGAATASALSSAIDVLVDGANNIYIADYGSAKVRKVNAAGIISTFAGSLPGGFGGDGFAATAAKMDGPTGLAMDAAGNMYISDHNNQRIRKVNTSGIISTIAGDGTAIASGDGFPATAAKIINPWGLKMDASGNLFFADPNNGTIREINAAGIMSTVIGGGSVLGDGGPALAGSLNAPVSLAIDASGNIYIGDENNNRIRKVNSLGPSSGIITGTVAVCPGNTGALTDATTGGVWSSSNTSIATVGGTGMVTGVASGTATISYAVTGGCGANPATMTVTVNPLPAAITGSANICMGTTPTLSDGGGGTWSSSNTLLATINSSGVVSPVAVGTPTITYTLGTGCYITKQVTVNPAAAAIGGTSSVCIGLTTALSNAAGGAWSSSNTLQATVNSSGLVTGVAAGTPTITYALGTGCAATLQVSVNTSPGTITGVASVCTGATTALTDAGGGTWSSNNTSLATVNSSGVVTGVAAGTPTITYTAGTGCFAIQSVTVLTAASGITGTQTVCTGLTTALTDAGGGAWSSSNTSLATVDASGVVTGVAAGTPTITYTLGTGCTTTLPVTVNTAPGSITGVTSVCIGATTALTDAGGGTWNSSNTSLATVNSSGLVTGVAVGAPVITYTLGTGCITTQSVSVLSAASGITGTQSVCTGLTTALTDAGGGTWTSSNTSLATVNSSGVVTGVAAGTPTITYTLGSGCTATLPVTVNAAPGAITGTTVVCVSATTALTDAGGGTWSSGNTSFATVNSSGVVSGVSAGTLTISYTLGTGCQTTTAVTVNPLPVAGTITGTTTVCVGANTTLTDAAAGGTWSSSNSLVSVAGGVVTGIAPGTSVVMYTTTNSCNSAVATATVTVNPLPNAGSITGPSSVCPATNISLTDVAAGGMWTFTNATASVSGGIVTGVAAGIDTIKYTVTNSCGTAITTKTIIVNPLPVAGSITGASAVCVSANITLSNTAGSGAWSSTNPAATVSGGVVTGVSQGTTTISYTVSLTCGTAAATKVITINPLPVAGTIIGTATAICAGTTTVVTDATAGGVWSSSATSVATVSFGTVSGMAAGTTTISYTVTNGCGSASAIRNLIVTPPLPNPGTITGVTTICMGSSTPLTDPAAGGVWNSSNTSVATVASTGIVTSVAPGTSAIYYAVTNTCGTAIASISVMVNPLPVSGTISGLSSVCSGLSTPLSDAATGGVWSSNATTIATVTSGGLVAGITPGGAIISYVVANACGTSIATYGMTVNAPLPTVSGITGGAGAFCAGLTVALSDTTSGGVWSSSETTVATVSSSGAVLGTGAGTATISYSVTSSCGTASVIKSIIVGNMPAAYNVTGGGPLCSDNTTVPVSLSGSATGIRYELISNLHGPIIAEMGTGSSIAFGTYTSPDTFTMRGIDVRSGCVAAMSGKAVVTTYNKPVVSIYGKAGQLTTGPDTFYVQVANIGTGTTYQWYINNSIVNGATGNSFIDNAYKYHDVIACHINTQDVCGTEHLEDSMIVDFSYDYPHENVPTHTNGQNNITVVPNPTNGNFIIKGSVATVANDELSYELVDMLGQVVYKNTMKAINGQINEQVSMNSSLANGTYLLQVHSNTEHVSFHIVLNR